MKNKNNKADLAEMAALDRIRGRCVVPEFFSSEERRTVVRVVHYVLDGLRDIGAFYPINKRSEDEHPHQLNLVVKSLGVRSSIIYLTPNQRQLTHEDNPLRQQLLDIKHHQGEDGKRAIDYLNEIERLSQIIRKSISVMQLGVIRGLTLENVLEGDSEELQCTILYQVLLPELLSRPAFYREATGLAANDIRKYLSEKGINVQSVLFREATSEIWSVSDVEEGYRPAVQRAFDHWIKGQKAA